MPSGTVHTPPWNVAGPRGAPVLRIFTLQSIGASVSACAIQFISSTRNDRTLNASLPPRTTWLRQASTRTT